ncbi:MAG: DUF512 domain-containing protein [Oscillospiraceae bacterium]
MSVKILSVDKNSPADKAGIKNGDIIISINSHKIRDVLDYKFYMTDNVLEIALESGNLTIKKGEYEDLGLEFETYLMDKQHSCKNKCIFCFVDQMPKGMRDSLYFKDDDERMSFLFGNYITLTNLYDEDIERIIKMRISPVNISVHTTNPELRVKMMANPRAAETLSYIKRLTDAGIKVNTQLVLCPDINDGEELEKSLDDLGNLYPNLQTISCVPVGLTDYREGLHKLLPYTKEQASKTIEIIENFSEKMLEKNGERLAFPADEFFIKSGRALPDYEYYGEFNQLENGIGLLTMLEEEFNDACAMANKSDKTRNISIATGVAAYPFIKKYAEKAMSIFPNLKVKVYEIVNDYFGNNITVAGLVTGTDLINKLSEKDLGEELIIPSVMLKYHENMFLDSITIEEVSTKIKTKIKVIEPDGFELLGAMLDDEELFS